MYSIDDGAVRGTETSPEMPWVDGSSYNAPGALDRYVAGCCTRVLPESASSLSLGSPVLGTSIH